MADAVKTIGHSMQKKAADELSSIEGHRPWPAAMAIVAEHLFPIDSAMAC